MPATTTEVECNELNDSLFTSKGIRLYIARLDKVHPIVSGNKLFKLHYFLDEALKHQLDIITFGGPYSNHLVACAYACKLNNIRVTGIVRGEETRELSPTLKSCAAYGMKLEFISRKAYNDIKNEFISNERILIIPEGGFHSLGVKGASIMRDKIKKTGSTHIITAIGTATTFAGLISENYKTIGVPVLNLTDVEKRLKHLGVNYSNAELWNDYHFGGYAKHNNTLISFMNEFYRQYKIPLDFVYTGKMMFGVIEKISAGYFPEGSIITCLHTGGLQGNSSIKDQLIYDV